MNDPISWFTFYWLQLFDCPAVNTKRQIFRNNRGCYVHLGLCNDFYCQKYMFECPVITRNTTESYKRDLSC